MITAEMEVLYNKLHLLKPVGVERSNAKNWIAFQVRTKRGKRNVVTIRREGVSFFTEDNALLDKLSALGAPSYKIIPDEGRSKLRYRFRDLKPEIIDTNADDFRKLFAESLKLKEFYS